MLQSDALYEMEAVCTLAGVVLSRLCGVAHVPTSNRSRQILLLFLEQPPLTQRLSCRPWLLKAALSASPPCILELQESHSYSRGGVDLPGPDAPFAWARSQYGVVEGGQGRVGASFCSLTWLFATLPLGWPFGRVTILPKRWLAWNPGNCWPTALFNDLDGDPRGPV
jgi:hypothetical protein